MFIFKRDVIVIQQFYDEYFGEENSNETYSLTVYFSCFNLPVPVLVQVQAQEQEQAQATSQSHDENASNSNCTRVRTKQESLPQDEIGL